MNYRCACGVEKVHEWGFDPMSPCVVCGAEDTRRPLAVALEELEEIKSVCRGLIEARSKSSFAGPNLDCFIERLRRLVTK